MADQLQDAPVADAEIIAAETSTAGDNGAFSRPAFRRRRPQRPSLNNIPDSYWKAATLFSFVVNAALLIVLIVAGLMLFQIKRAIAQPLVGGLHTSFEAMDAAHIITTIQVNDTIQVVDTIHVNDTIPVVFDVPLSTNTTVVLTNDTVIPRTLVNLNGIAVPTDITLPAGTPLNINLNLVVPVSKTVPVVLEVPVALQVPVHLTVPVDIPLKKTELHTPFNDLVNLVAPYSNLLDKLPSSWGDLFGLK
jgi:hypothetical protein